MYLFVLYLVVYAIKGVDSFGSSDSEVWDRADETAKIIDLVNKAENFEVNSTLRSADDEDDDDDKDDGDKDADDKAYGIERVDPSDSPDSKVRDGASETARIINFVNKADNLEVKYSLRAAVNKDDDRKDKADEDLDIFESMTAIPNDYDIRKFIEFSNNPREHHINNPEVLETYKNSRVSDGNHKENPTYAHAHNQLKKSRKCRSLRRGGKRTESDEHMTLEYETDCSEDEDNVGEFGFIDESKSIDEVNDPEQAETAPNNIKEIKELNGVQADEILKPIIKQMLNTYTININQENEAYKSKEQKGNANMISKENNADTDIKLSYKSWESKINAEDLSSEVVKSTNEQTNKEPNGESSSEYKHRAYIILQNNMFSNTRTKETHNNEGKKKTIKQIIKKSGSFETHRKSLGNRDLWSQKNDSFRANERKSEVWNNQDTIFNDFIDKPDTMNENRNLNKKQDWNRKDKLKNDESFDDKWNKTIAKNNNNDKWGKKDDWNKKDGWNKKDDGNKKDDWNKKDDSWNNKERVKNNGDDKWDKKEDWNRKDDWDKPDDSYNKKYDKDNKKDDRWSLRDDKRNKKDDSYNKKDDSWNKKDDNWNKKDDNWDKKDDNWNIKDDNWNKKDNNWNKRNDNWNKKDNNWNLRDDRWNKKDDNWNKKNDRSSNRDDSWNKRDADDYNKKRDNKYDDKDNNFNYKKEKRNQPDEDWNDRDNYRNKKSNDWYSKEKRNKKKNIWDENENGGNKKRLERGDLKRDSAWDNVGIDNKNAQWGNYEVFKKLKEKNGVKEDSYGQEKINFPKVDRSLSKYSSRDDNPPKRVDRDDYYEKPKRQRGGNGFARTAIPHRGKRPVYD